MKQNKFFLGLATIAAAVFAFTSCSQDELSTAKAETPDLGQEILLSTNFSTTRTVSQDIQTGTQIVSGVQVGVFVATNGSNTSFVENGTNKAYTADGNGGLTAVDTENKVYYPKTGSVDIYAYAPYQSTWNVTDVNDDDQDFTVQADQSSDDNYKASDLIWATPKTGQASTTDALALPFFHKLSKINVTVVNQRSGLSLKGATIYILNTKPTASIYLGTGELKKENNVVVTSGDVTTITAATLDAGESEPTATASAIIVPQTLAAGTKFVKIVTSATYNTTEGSTTLYAKLGTGGKTFESGNVYKYTVTIKENSVELSLGSTTLSGWTENEESLDAEDSDTPEVGDYIKKDGTFLKASAITDDNKDDIIAVIFSKTKHDTGWDGYAMGLATLSGKNWGNSYSWLSDSDISTWANAYEDYAGMSKTSSILLNSTYTSLDENAKANVLANLNNYTLTINTGVTNLSSWFTPSIGQMIEILNNLGKASLSESTGFADNNSSSVGWGYTSESDPKGTSVPSVSDMVTVQTKINTYVTAAGKDAFGAATYATVTESGKSSGTQGQNGYKKNFWHVTFNATLGYSIGQNIAKNPSSTSTTWSVIPCIAYKVTNE